MRSQCDSRLTGSGTAWAFTEPEESYQDRKAGYVRFPNDFKTDEELAQLSGKCKTIHKGGENENEV